LWLHMGSPGFLLRRFLRRGPFGWLRRLRRRRRRQSFALSGAGRGLGGSLLLQRWLGRRSVREMRKEGRVEFQIVVLRKSKSVKQKVGKEGLDRREDHD